ncbi:MAG: putative Ig domain-containing protein [Patescibacteria group bacterium]|jgi:hypothetical protein
MNNKHVLYPVLAVTAAVVVCIAVALAAVGINAATAKPEALRITTTSLPAWISGTQAKYQLIAKGGTPPLVWSVKSGALPSGFKLTPDGVISGMTILSSGVTKKTFAPFVVQVKDKKGKTQTVKLSITVKPSPPAITTANPPDLTVGQSYNVTIATASGGMPPYKFAREAVSGPMPFGMQITTVGSKAHLTGAPKAKGHFAFRVCVTDTTKTEKCGDVAFNVKDKVTSETWQGTITTQGRCVCSHASGSGCDPGDGSLSGSMTFTFTMPEALAEAMKRTDRFESGKRRGTGTLTGSETVALQQPPSNWGPSEDCTLVGGSASNIPLKVQAGSSQGSYYKNESAAIIDLDACDNPEAQRYVTPGGRESSQGIAGQTCKFSLLVPSVSGTQFSGKVIYTSPGTGTFTLTKVQ